MNIDYLSNLIEGADVSAFRTIAAIFLRSIGYSHAFLSDGPYDGAADFYVYKDKVTGVETAFQLSIEKDWRKKLMVDIKKVKINYPKISTFIFVSKRRIPLRSFQTINARLVQEFGFSVIHYDNQAIATELIDKNKVSRLFELLGIPVSLEDNEIFVTPSAEAASAVLMFGAESGNFRSEMFENLLSAELLRSNSVLEADFVASFLEQHQFGVLQKADVLRHIERAVQSEKIERRKGFLELSEKQRLRLLGIRSLVHSEFNALTGSVNSYLATTELESGSGVSVDILKNLLELSVSLWRRAAPQSAIAAVNNVDQTFHVIHSGLSLALSPEQANKVISDLADIVSRSDFAKQIAAAELFNSLLHTDSQQLVAALGGVKGINTIFDTPVVIPLLCGLLFDPVQDHSAYSAKLLIDLLRHHRFSGFVPIQYVEESAAHLIDCCRHYRPLILAGEDLSYSTNAFASHYCQLTQLSERKVDSFDSYISVFGAPLSDRFSDMSDAFFYAARDKIVAKMNNLLRRYGIEVLELDGRKFVHIQNRLTEIMLNLNQVRANLLLEHDARVIAYLEGTETEAGIAKILCTWDSMHFRYNPTWDGYCVMNPAAITDLLSIIRSDENGLPMTQLVDYIWLQSESSLKLSAKIWDEIVLIEKDKLTDAALLHKARAFRENYIATHQSPYDMHVPDIASLWLKWKQTNA